MKTLRRWAAGLPFYLTAGMIAIALILPLAWMVAASLRLPGLPPSRGVEWLPRPFSWSNYRAVFEIVPLGRYLLNSLLVTGSAVGLTIIAASWGGFGMSQLGRRGQRILVVLSIALLLVHFGKFNRIRLRTATDAIRMLIMRSLLSRSFFVTV